MKKSFKKYTLICLKDTFLHQYYVIKNTRETPKREPNNPYEFTGDQILVYMMNAKEKVIVHPPIKARGLIRFNTNEVVNTSDYLVKLLKKDILCFL